jgi:hypothetical protein
VIDPELQALIDAEAILESLTGKLARGPMFPYAKVKHAKDYINKQIADYFTAFSDSEAAA